MPGERTIVMNNESNELISNIQSYGNFNKFHTLSECVR